MKNRLSKKEYVIIVFLIFVLIQKYVYMPFMQNIDDNTKSLIESAFLFVWFIVGIVLLSYGFTNLFSAIAIKKSLKKIDKKSSEYLNKTQEYYIKLNNAKYFGKIFGFIYLLYKSMFVMSLIFMIYNFILSIIEALKIKKYDSNTKEYREVINNLNRYLDEMLFFDLLATISIFYLGYEELYYKLNVLNKEYISNLYFQIEFVCILIKTFIYSIFFKKRILKDNNIKKKFIFSYIYIILFLCILILIFNLSRRNVML